MSEAPKFGPKRSDHPSIGQECPACKEPFKEGDYTTLVALGPGNDLDDQNKCRAGKPYNAVAIEVHYSCVTGIQVQEIS